MLDVTAKTTEQNRIVRTSEFEVEVTNNKKNCARRIVLELEAMTLTTDRFEASRGLFATAELLVAPVRESQLEYWHNVSYEKKTKMVGLPDGERQFENVFTRFDTIHERDG